jgi:regulatory protein
MLNRMQPADNETYRKALNSALRILSRRDHSILELHKKLEARGFLEEHIRRVVAECRRLGYLDDERAAHALIERFKYKGCGARRIRFELRQSGLSGDHIVDLLQKRLSSEEELGLARRALERKLKTCPTTEAALTLKGRLYRFLFGRGFSESAIRAALDELSTIQRKDPSGSAG